MDAEIEHILTMTDADILADARARGIDPEQNAIEMRVMFERVTASVPRVSLPAEPVVEEAPAEETQPPSGWRDRPGLL
jgi:hypothetical protein